MQNSEGSIMLRQIIIGRPNGIRRKVATKAWEILTSYFDDDSSDSMTSESNTTDSFESSVQKEYFEPPKGVTPPEGFEVVLHKNTLQMNEVTQVIVAGTAIAIARTEDGFFAIENTCPHADGPMSDGWIEGNQISCPYHGWSLIYVMEVVQPIQIVAYKPMIYRYLMKLFV